MSPALLFCPLQLQFKALYTANLPALVPSSFSSPKERVGHMIVTWLWGSKIASLPPRPAAALHLTPIRLPSSTPLYHRLCGLPDATSPPPRPWSRSTLTVPRENTLNSPHISSPPSLIVKSRNGLICRLLLQSSIVKSRKQTFHAIKTQWVLQS